MEIIGSKTIKNRPKLTIAFYPAQYESIVTEWSKRKRSGEKGVTYSKIVNERLLALSDLLRDDQKSGDLDALEGQR